MKLDRSVKNHNGCSRKEEKYLKLKAAMRKGRSMTALDSAVMDDCVFELIDIGDDEVVESEEQLQERTKEKKHNTDESNTTNEKSTMLDLIDGGGRLEMNGRWQYCGVQC